MRGLWLCLCLLVASEVRVYADSERGTKANGDKVGKDRQIHKKGTHSKPKLHYTTTAAHEETKYGVDLPSFAFDYSEYFSGAVIERSHDKDLYLTVFMVGHKAISTDFPFHAISTDEEVMHSWSKAVKLWDKSGNKRASSASRRLNAIPTESPPRSHNPYSTYTSHSTQSSSGLVCVLQNNDVTPSQVYQATAYWVHAEHDTDSTSNKNIFAILRCKLRNTAHFYEPDTNRTSKALFVDIMRMNALKKTHTKHSARNNASTSATTTTSSDKVASDNRGSVLSSFSVPWITRVSGYPMQQHSSASTVDPWSIPHTINTTPSISTTSTSGTAATPTARTTLTSPTATSTILCVPNIRPLHPTHPTSLSVLIEYVEHNLQLGFSHVMLGVALDWKSKHMHRFLHVLQTYVKSGHVSVYSTALPGYDDVSGFGGIQLDDVYAEQYFVNMCLYYSKGMHRFVSVGHVGESIVPVEEHYSASGNTFVHSIVSKLVSSAGASSIIPTTTRGSSKVHANSAIQHAPCTYALTTQSTSANTITPNVGLRGSSSTSSGSANSGIVAGRLDVYGIGLDAGNAPKPLFNDNNTYNVLFLPTDRVVRVDVSPNRVVTGQCKSVLSQQRRGKHGSAGSVLGVQNSTSSVVSSTRTAILYTTTADVDTPNVALFVHKSTPSPIAITTIGVTATTVLQKYLQARDRLHNVTTTALSKRSITPTSIEALSDESAVIFTAAHKSAQAAKPFNPFSDAPIPDKNQLSGEVPTRDAIKAPFWQLCNTDYLKDVIRKVFHA